MSIVIKGNTVLKGSTIFGTIPSLCAGRVDTTFVIGAGFNLSVNGVKVQSDGKILVGGSFTTYSGISANRIIRLNEDGSKDNSFAYGTGFTNIVYIINVQSNGKILVGGTFASYSGISVNRIIRLNSDGSRDDSFVSGTGPSSTVYGIDIQSNGKILLGGSFITYSGISANCIIRLNEDGSKDNSFVYGTGFNAQLTDVKLQSDGKILACGSFSTYSGISANNIIRLLSGGSKDDSFVSGIGFNSTVYSIDIQSDGKILLGGVFTTYSGISANRIIRLNSNGSKDNSFVYGTGFDNQVNSIKVQSDGKILVGGVFSTYDGTSANRIIRLNEDGSRDNSFAYGIGFNSNINYNFGIGIQSNNDIVVGGQFTLYNNNSYNRIIRLKSSI